MTLSLLHHRPVYTADDAVSRPHRLRTQYSLPSPPTIVRWVLAPLRRLHRCLRCRHRHVHTDGKAHGLSLPSPSHVAFSSSFNPRSFPFPFPKP
ncbi:hypothetical protein R3P38DRAFT_3298253 [Favolaschia claudopus]|uniref:Uncharacterized protein n=1 Tax=Favolaschia claudopus TaxID=2862362 RepID=A0AAV9Z449_9AGAR